MALKEYIGIQRLTQAFSLLKNKIDAKAELAESMTTEEFEDAENLPDGLYPIEEEDLVPITADMVKYDSGHTVEDKIDGLNADFIGATSEDAGTHGLVPAPQAGDEDKCLKGDGTWGKVDASTVRYNDVAMAIQVLYNGTWYDFVSFNPTRSAIILPYPLTSNTSSPVCTVSGSNSPTTAYAGFRTEDNVLTDLRNNNPLVCLFNSTYYVDHIGFDYQADQANNTVLVTTDGGNTWTNVATLPIASPSWVTKDITVQRSINGFKIVGTNIMYIRKCQAYNRAEED